MGVCFESVLGPLEPTSSRKLCPGLPSFHTHHGGGVWGRLGTRLSGSCRFELCSLPFVVMSPNLHPLEGRYEVVCLLCLQDWSLAYGAQQ